MELLEGAVREYAWGSPTGIPEILGSEPDGRPLAELWLGAHPQGAATVVRTAAGREAGRGLDALIADDPERLLGREVLERFGPRLPFLLKLLSARTALSIQTHPTLAQARAGFAAEEARGIPRDAPERSYRDEWHKPELVCALSEFHALCGFRPLAAVRATADRLAAAAGDGLGPELAGALTEWRSSLSAGGRPWPTVRDEARILRHSLSLVLSDPGRYGPLADALAATEVPEAEAGHPSLAGSCVDPVRTLRETNRDFPGDPGALVALMLMRFLLQPGEALALEAGVLHAYLGGLAVEVMASSDNVLRGGLTAKHIDVDELVATTGSAVAVPHILTADAVGELRGSTDDFVLTVLDLRDREAASPVTRLTRPGPLVLLCVDGAVTVSAEPAGGSLPLASGQAVFVGADEPRPAVSGTGLVFAASAAL
ncbi:mannose-6-phosphate isomerase, class I [Brevibacterium album]|uniref:mannose-6-phosphate isomerase, class I n=1 Tax=Brevibacterium album TaxID=417948 RepID=UPI000419E819|nr:mannose-6-phosphate isomerase, class I [Brevibacterium album]